MEKFRYRLRYSKLDNAVYLSHLDLMRTFTRAFKRADIPIWYTEGFTPRAYLDFPMPLPLGVGGTNEILYIVVSEPISDSSNFSTQINSCLSGGITVKNIAEANTETALITSAEYRIGPASALSDSDVAGFIRQDSIIGQKFSKKRGYTTIDIKPLLTDLHLSQDDGFIYVKLPAGPNFNLNVNVFIKALASFFDRKSELFYATRLNLLLNSGDIFV